MFYFKTIKASSLANAVLLCVLVSVFLGCLVLAVHYHNFLNAKFERNEQLINTNNATFTYYANRLNALAYNTPLKADVLNEAVTSTVIKKKWGYYDILSCQTIFKSDTVSKIAMMGIQNRDKKHLAALYVTDYDKILRLSGKISLAGNLYIPKSQIDHFYLNNSIKNTINVTGTTLNSKKRLPKLTKKPIMDLSNFEYKSINSLDISKPIFNSFHSKTVVIDVSNLSTLKNLNIKGNLIVYSSKSLHISKQSSLKDVIIYAKNITIEKNFNGTVHIVAKNNVTIENDVNLRYPSSIYVENSSDAIRIKIKKSSKIAGGIVLNSPPQNTQKHQLVIENDVEIYGMVYCMGKTQLEGRIYGSLYTDRLFLETKSSSYENIIHNGSVDNTKLPTDFIQIPIFNSKLNTNNYQIIKTL